MKIPPLLVILLFLFACQSSETQETPKPWSFESFDKVDSLNPILKPSSELTFVDPITESVVRWEERNVLNPTALVLDDKVHLLYRAQDSLGTSRIGLAISEDGVNFEKMPSPIFFPDNDDMKLYEWSYLKKEGATTKEPLHKTSLFDGVEDPRIVQSPDGRFFMTYTSYDGKTARLCIASSSDLKSWTKHGLVLSEEGYADTWSKAGAILVEKQGNKMVATRVDGKYWMYFGDTDIFLAYSEDLVTWKLAINEESKKRISVLHPRSGYFDSRLVEPGPYALKTKEGILLIYNASNAANFNDDALPKYTYAAGQALFDADSPNKLINRTASYFIYPDKDYEKIGEVNEVCFVEGLVYFQDKWFLYYGTADSKIAVAVSTKAPEL